MRCVGTIDDYLTDLDAADRAVIDRVYAIAREEVPEAEQGTGLGGGHAEVGGGTGTGRLRPEHPLPEDAVRALVRARVSQIDAA